MPRRRGPVRTPIPGIRCPRICRLRRRTAGPLGRGRPCRAGNHRIRADTDSRGRLFRIRRAAHGDTVARMRGAFFVVGSCAVVALGACSSHGGASSVAPSSAPSSAPSTAREEPRSADALLQTRLRRAVTEYDAMLAREPDDEAFGMIGLAAPAHSPVETTPPPAAKPPPPRPPHDPLPPSGRHRHRYHRRHAIAMLDSRTSTTKALSVPHRVAGDPRRLLRR